MFVCDLEGLHNLSLVQSRTLYFNKESPWCNVLTRKLVCAVSSGSLFHAYMNASIDPFKQNGISFSFQLDQSITRALTRILKTGVPEPSLPKSGSPTIQKNMASFKK